MSKSSRKGRTMIWLLGAIVIIGITGAIALQVAIARNGPAVLDTVDRLAGGHRDVSSREAIAYGEHPDQSIYLHHPVMAGDEDKLPVVVFIHGGSWASGDPADYNFIGRAFSGQDFVTVNAGYRLGEDGRFPAMLEDGAAALRWVHQNIASHGGDPDHIIVAGHSAGAYNAAMLALDRQWLGREGLDPAIIKGVIGLAGPYDFYPFDSESTKAAFGKAPRPEATQPVNYVRADAAPMILIHGEKDTVVKPRNTRELARRVVEAGGQVSAHYFPEMAHTDPLLSLASPWRRNREVIDLVIEFARAPEASVSVQAKTR